MREGGPSPHSKGEGARSSGIGELHPLVLLWHLEYLPCESCSADCGNLQAASHDKATAVCPRLSRAGSDEGCAPFGFLVTGGKDVLLVQHHLDSMWSALVRHTGCFLMRRACKCGSNDANHSSSGSMASGKVCRWWALLVATWLDGTPLRRPSKCLAAAACCSSAAACCMRIASALQRQDQAEATRC